MAGLDPAIYRGGHAMTRASMRGSSPRMTKIRPDRFGWRIDARRLTGRSAFARRPHLE